MKTAFKRDEMVSATTVAKNFGKVISDLSEHRKEKVAVVRNNEIIAVILPVDDYEYMADVVEFVEPLEIYDMVTKRKKSGGKRVPLDRLLKEEGVAV
jgi:PHD/YefM family antitoxin component YafN of YafNO toxin-antitoxin module